MTPPEIDALVAAALAARERAYAPYSNFFVGAALLTASGNVFPGCNVENAAYSMAICAERTALVSAVAAGERQIVAVAVVTDTLTPASPCGACRQMLLELAPGATLALTNLRGDLVLTTPEALLPGGFTGATLRGQE